MDNRPMIRKSSAIITIAANATPETLYQRTTGSQNARSVILRKVMTYNAVGATTLRIGTGLGGAFANIIPTLRLVNNMDDQWTQDQIPEVEVGADLTVQTDILGVMVQVEVDEIGD